MATYTPNLNLKKPSTGEKYDVVADLNDSKDKVDNAIGNHALQLGERVKKGDLFINVKDYGAIGNGIIDDTQSFIDALTACTAGNTLYIPLGSYLIKQKLVIDKNMTILGSNMQDDEQNLIPLTGSVLLFDGLEFQGSAIEIKANGVCLENIFIKNISAVKTNIQMGINIVPFIGGVVWNITLKNIWVKGFGTHNIFATGLLLSTFDHVFSSDSVNGFYFDNPTLNGTSLSFNNCWSMRNTGYAFYLYSYNYCNFTACAADVNDISYALVNCKSITFNGCGSELTNKEHVHISNCNGITLNGVFGHDGNKLNNGGNGASFLNSVNSDNVTLIGCTDDLPAFGTTSVFSTKNLVVINSNLPLNLYVNGSGYNNSPNNIIAKIINLV